MSYNQQINGHVTIYGKQALQCISCRNHAVPRFAWQYAKPQEYMCAICFDNKCPQCGFITSPQVRNRKYFPKNHPLHKLCQTCVNAYNAKNCGVCHIDTMPQSTMRCRAHYQIPITRCVTCNKNQAQTAQQSRFDCLYTTTHDYCDDCRPTANAKNQKLQAIADKQKQIATLKQKKENIYKKMFYPGLVVDLSYILTFKTDCTTTNSDDDDVVTTTLIRFVVKETRRLPMSINDESYIDKFTGELNTKDLPDSYQSIDGDDYADTDDVFKCGNLISAHVRRFEPISLSPTTDNSDIVAINEQLKALETH